MTDYWPDTLASVLGDEPCVLVTVIEVRGSAPRPVGARMLLTRDSQFGSIGGGRLEFKASDTARTLLGDANGDRAQSQHYGLGPALNQCCGGAVTLLFERLTDPHMEWLQDMQTPAARRGDGVLATAVDRKQVYKAFVRADRADADSSGLMAALGQFARDEITAPALVEVGQERYLLEAPCEQAITLALFGAGHVATAFARLSVDLPFRLTWFDSREAQFPEQAARLARVVVSHDPASDVARCAPGTAYLVMTHSHELDEDICAAVLQRDDFAWLGLIGSNSKRRRFVHRLAKRGIPEAQLQRLVCPVGMAGISGKRPATIALSIAAQLHQDCVPAAWR